MRTLAFPAATRVCPLLANGLMEEDDDYFEDGAFSDPLNSLDIDDDDWDEEGDDEEDDEENDDDEDEE